jgi:hypothetical protein
MEKDGFGVLLLTPEQQAGMIADAPGRTGIRQNHPQNANN